MLLLLKGDYAAASFCFLRRAMKPMRLRAASIIAKVSGPGTGDATGDRVVDPA